MEGYCDLSQTRSSLAKQPLAILHAESQLRRRRRRRRETRVPKAPHGDEEEKCGPTGTETRVSESEDPYARSKLIALPM